MQRNRQYFVSPPLLVGISFFNEFYKKDQLDKS